MLSHTQEDTPLSLLERLRTKDSEAWQEFSGRYVRILERWCSSWGIQPNDADDIVQNTLLVVLSRISVYEHRGAGSFRAWMKTISWRCWCDVVARADRENSVELSESLRATPAAFESLEAEFDKLVVEELLQTCMAKVRRRVEANTWDAFRLTALEAMPAAEVALQLDMSVDAVYAARCRIQRWISQEFERSEE